MKKSELKNIIKEEISKEITSNIDKMTLQLSDIVVKYKSNFKNVDELRTYLFNWVADLTTSSMTNESSDKYFNDTIDKLRAIKSDIKSLLKNRG